MRIEADVTSQQPTVTLRDPDDFHAFKVVALGSSGAALEAALEPVGKLLAEGDALIAIEALERLAGERAEDPAWRAGFERMIDYARSHDWLSADGSSIQAHCEWASLNGTEVLYPSSEISRCPYPHYAAMRADDPVHEVPGRGEFVIARHEDILTVLRDTDTFSAAYSVTVEGVQRPATLTDVKAEAVRGMAASDPPVHTVKRKIAFKYLKPARVREYLPTVTAIVDELIDGFADRGRAEFISEFAALLPARVILAVFDLPAEDVGKVIRWSGFEGQATRYHAPEAQERVYDLVRDMGAYLEQVVLDRHETPGDDVLSRLIADHVDANGGELDLPNVRADLTNLINGGTITTTHMLGNTMRNLLRNPDVVARAQEDGRVFVRAIEESLRYEAPVQYMPRVCTADTELGGVRIPAGAHVLLAYASANRDEAHFEAPDDFDVDRDNLKNHLSFGFNLHFCMGAPLAREEGRIAFERLFERLPGLRMGEDNELEPIDSLAFRGLRELNLEFQLASP